MKLTKKFFCPVNGWDCLYWKKDGSCAMVDEGDDPVTECDDAGYFWDEEQPDCFVWVDENGTQYEAQELLEMGYHFVNDEPIFDPTLAPAMKIAAEILKSLPMGMQEIKIRNPNWEG